MKEYKKEDLTVVWDAEKCIHSAICAKGLPSVFKPKDRPWIQTENASKEDIMNIVSKCPSGALTFYLGDKKDKNMSNETTKVQIKENGPLLVAGDLTITNADGSEEQKSRVTAFCRCGASENKPYCDGAHNAVGFKG